MLRRLAALAALALVGCGGANLPPVELPDLAAPPAVDGAIDDGPPPPPTDLARGCSATSPRAVPVTLYALPEAGELPFVELLQRAQRSIRVMVYLMGRGGILDTLKAKAKAGVQVQVILDRQQSANAGYSKELQQAGAQVKLSDARFTYSHAKFFVVDETEATIATGNYSLSYLQKERNFVARDGDPADVADLVQLFDADWGGGPLDLACTRLLVSPINARQRLLELIRSATNTLAVESMQLADDEIRLALAERRRAGVAVRVLLADPSWITANRDAARVLAPAGIELRYRVAPSVHVKAITADGARAYVGSENLSYTSLTKNREVGLIATEPAAVELVARTFETDWSGASSF